MPADVRDITGALVKLDAETWGIVTPGGETFALVQRGSVAVPVPGDGSVRLVRLPASPSDYASGIAFLPGATVHAVGFAVEGGGEKAGGDATELELVSLDLMAFDLGGGVVDTDGDTMDDAFEEHFLNGLGASFWDDSDGDGFSDGEEYLALINPADPGSFPPGMPALPRNLTVAAEGGNIVLRWDGSAAAAYTVEFGDLLGWDPSPQAPIQSAPGRFEWSGPLPTGSQFFRVATNLQ
ncbi:MAG: hypothetical protein KDC95_23845, partial [Planctomycetes bacterium]|nr:hypothetical protein [Planctomycetota bacterium]